MRKLGLAIVALALAAFVSGPVWAGHNGGLPAGKVLIAADDSLILDTDTDDGAAEVKTLFGPTGYKMSTSGDITVSVHMECKIVTKTKVRGNAATGGAQTEDSERGFARVWILIEDIDDATNFVILNTLDLALETDPICNETGATGPTCIAVIAGAVTMCDRLQTLKLTSSGDEILDLNVATLQTHGFTWFGEDISRVLGTNQVDISVKARVFGDDGGIINVRKRVMEINTVHFAH